MRAATAAISAGDINRDGLPDRVLPTVNKAEGRDSASGSSERLLPTVNKAQDESSSTDSERLLPTVNKKVTVRGWDPEKKQEIAAKIEAQASADENMKAADISEDEVAIDYSEPAKLFGVIPTNLGFTISADASGRVKVRFPWYRFLFGLGANDVASDAMHVYQRNQTDLEFLKVQQDTSVRQSGIFTALSNILKTRHDAAVSASGSAQ